MILQISFFYILYITNDFFFPFFSDWVFSLVISKSWDKLQLYGWFCPLVSHASIMVITLPSLLVPSVTPYISLPNPFCLPLSPHSLPGSCPGPQLQPRGSDRVREQKHSVFSAVLHSQVGAARSATVSLRRAHKHKAACCGRDEWLEKQKAWRTDAAHTIFPSWRQGSKKWVCSLSLPNLLWQIHHVFRVCLFLCYIF